MGVQIYLLEHQTTEVSVGGLVQEIGILRRSWKATEFNDERSKEISTAKAKVQGSVAPMAVMLADVDQLTLASEPDRRVAAHLVIGWDSDRSMVTDFGWDFLPVTRLRRQGEPVRPVCSVREDDGRPVTDLA